MGTGPAQWDKDEMAHLRGNERVVYVRAMFTRIARRYDLMNTLVTLGRDQAWRRYALRQAALPPGGRLLDVGTGTGNIALEAARLNGNLTVVGVDFSPAMMRVAQQRPGGERVIWCEADALALPFPDATFDAVISGYLVRNVTDVAAAFREQVRVVKPGGRIVCLETSPPPHSPLRPFILFYLWIVIPLVGRLITGDGPAYVYLPESTHNFKTPEQLAAIMSAAGLSDVRYRQFMLGTMAVHIGTRNEELC